MSDDWSKSKEKQISRIKELKPQDRLSLVEAIAEIYHYIVSSCQGWMQWVYNPMIASQFNQEKLQEVFDTFRKFAMDFLEFDIRQTKGLGEALKKQSEKAEPRSPTYT